MGAHGPPMRTSPDRIAGVHAEMANLDSRPIRWMVGTLITRTAAAMPTTWGFWADGGLRA